MGTPKVLNVTPNQKKIDDAQKNYELTIREHLDRNGGSSTEQGRGLGRLYENVRNWQESLEPVLAEEGKRKEFNFWRYGEESRGTVSGVVGVSILPQVGFLLLRICFEGKRTFSGVQKISPMGLTTFWPFSQKPKIGHPRDHVSRFL